MRSSFLKNFFTNTRFGVKCLWEFCGFVRLPLTGNTRDRAQWAKQGAFVGAVVKISHRYKVNEILGTTRGHRKMSCRA